MRRNSDARSRNPLPRRFPLVLGQILWIGINLLICIIGALQQRKPVGINIAYSKGVEFLTGNHLTPGFIFEILILGSILASVRWLILEYYAYYGSAPIEVRPLENASDLEVNTRALDVSFRDYLTTPRIYQVTA